jgi:hypothetical protein
MANATEQQEQDPSHGEHGAKEITIVVNGTPKTVTKGEISYEEVVDLAFDGNPPTGDNVRIVVTYHRGHGEKPEGTLIAGESVRVKQDMEFDATPAGRS